MLRKLTSIVVVACCGFSVRAAEVAAPPTTAMARPAELLFADDFSRAEVGTAWKSSVRSYSIRDGVLVTGQRPDAGHPAVCRVSVALQDCIVDFRFKFAGGSQLSLVLNDAGYKHSHAGHICRAQVSPTAVTLGDDKEGAMKLGGVFELRSQPEKRAEYEKLIENRRTRVPHKLDIDLWHRMTVEIVGDEMLASIDGRPIAYLRSPGFAHPTKNYWGFTTQGRFIEIDDVRAWSAVLDPNWSKRRSELFEARR